MRLGLYSYTILGCEVGTKFVAQRYFNNWFLVSFEAMNGLLSRIAIELRLSIFNESPYL